MYPKLISNDSVTNCCIWLQKSVECDTLTSKEVYTLGLSDGRCHALGKRRYRPASSLRPFRTASTSIPIPNSGPAFTAIARSKLPCSRALRTAAFRTASHSK